MKRHITMTGAVALTLFVSAGPAPAQSDPDDFTPEGYEWCGWRDFIDGGWTYGDPPDGVWLRVFALKMSCYDARRNATRMRYGQLPPYRPIRPGYTCKSLAEDWEYADVRCTKKNGKRKFRFQTGA